MDFQLPPWLQIAVALATILSSLGVIAAFSQIIVTINQFKKQVVISQKQLELTVRQFKSINQGYLSSDGQVVLKYHPVDNILIYDYYQIELILTNKGNVPITAIIENCFQYSGNKVLNPKSVYDQTFIIYPDESINFDYIPIYFRDNGIDGVKYDVLTKNEITFDFICTYTDFNSSKEKQINRKGIIIFEETSAYIKYIEIKDVIDDLG